MSKAYIVTDLSYGDAGKGTTVDYLARQAGSTVIVRHNGGPQAAHNVITPDGRHHTFAQFGSGSFVPGVRTYLSKHMLVNPLNMFLEADHLIELGVTDIWKRTFVDGKAMIITPWHQAANRLREKSRGDGWHGSCAQGVGEAMSASIERPDLVIRVADIANRNFIEKLQAMRCFLQERLERELGRTWQDDDWHMLADEDLAFAVAGVYRPWSRLVSIVDESYLYDQAEQSDQLIFEGAQGVLLDEWHGFHPYTTWSTTTSANALSLLDDIGFGGDVKRLGVIRAYTTRHGPGPFVTESPSLTTTFPEPHNGTGKWQGIFRRGHLDLVAHEYAISANGGIDELVVTGLDLSDEWRYCTHYQPLEASDVSRFFGLANDGSITNIRPGTPGDESYRDRLGVLMTYCRPLYHPQHVVDGTQLLATINETLGVPITLTSYGPTAFDKHTLVPLR